MRVAVAAPGDPTVVVWKTLKAAILPDYWVTVFPGQVDPGWTV